MAYVGTSVVISLGPAGLHTDNPSSEIPANAAIKATNVSLYRSKVEKAPGSTHYNLTTLGSPVVSVSDWFPTPTSQRMIAMTADGKVWRDSGDQTFGAHTPIATGLGTLTPDCMMVSGGALTVADPRKLFLFFGGSAVPKTITGDTSFLTSLTGPAADWATNYPTFGVVFQGRMVVFGNANRPHTLYVSKSDDHGDFRLTQGAAKQFTSISKSGAGPAVSITMPDVLAAQQFTVGDIIGAATTIGGTYSTNPNTVLITSITGTTIVGTASVNPSTGLSAEWANGNYIQSQAAVVTKDSFQQNVFSGEGDRISSAFVYKGALIIFKKPYGAYLAQWDGVSNFLSITRFAENFGISSPHAICQALDDLLGGNAAGSITSLKATDAFGSLEQGDVLNACNVRDDVRQNFDNSGLRYQQALYYPEKQVAYFTGASTPSSGQDRMIVIDAASKTGPRVTYGTKDQATCLALRKDVNGVQRPIYGSNDGFVYLMDQNVYTVAGRPYVGEFQTPYTDFSYMDSSLAGKVKLFDFLEMTYSSVGSWSFYVDVYVEGKFVETITYRQAQGDVLGLFILGSGKLGGVTQQKTRNPLHCSGRAVSFRVYNNNANEYFRVERLVVGFRLSAEQNRSSKS